MKTSETPAQAQPFPGTFQADSASSPHDKRFACLICNKKFSSKHCLKEHQFIHTGEKPYQCVVCLIFFKHASQLSVHKKTHRGRQETTWPKLTDLLKKSSESTAEYFETRTEVVELPLITTPQTWIVPSMSFINQS